MGIDVEVTKEEPQPYAYPCIKIFKPGQGSALIVLFTEKDKGVLLHAEGSSKSVRRIGAYYDDWAEFGFTPFNGSVTLKNQ